MATLAQGEGWRWRRDGGVMALVVGSAFALYTLLGQGVLYGDGHEFMVLLHQGAVGHKNHLAYLPLLRAAGEVLGPFGWSPFEAARACSAAGAALGVALLYGASRGFGLERRTAAWVAALIGVCPSVVFFATVVEVHAPYFACLGLAWVATAWVVRVPSPTTGVALGLACGVAYLGHASGLVLPGPLLFVALHLSRGPRRKVIVAALVAVVVHVAFVFLVPWLLRGAGHVADPAGAGRFMAWWDFEVFDRPERALLVLWDEWLLPYMPLSLLWLRAFRSARRTASVALLSLLPYLVLSMLLLAVYREFGAYQHAVVWLFAWLSVRAWPTRVLALAVAVSLVVGGMKVFANDKRVRVTEYRDGLAEVTGPARALLLVADGDDLEACFVALPDTPIEILQDARYVDPTLLATTLSALDARIAAHRSAGGRTFLTAGAIGWIGQPSVQAAHPGIATLFAHLRDDFRLESVGARGFRAYELLPK